MLVHYVAAVAATPPVLAADAIGGHAAKVRSLTGPTPSAVSSLARSIADDLSGPPALVAFRLSQPIERRVVRRGVGPLSLAGRNRFANGERGPPPTLS
jgi:hypothetical protein